MTDETNTMNDSNEEDFIFETDTDATPVEGTGREVGFHAAGTFAEFEGMGREEGGMPLMTAVKTGMRNGYPIYETDLLPLMEGNINHGGMQANLAIAGLHFIEHDRGPDGHNLLARARAPKGRQINAMTVGRALRAIVDQRYVRARGSMVAVGPRSRSE